MHKVKQLAENKDFIVSRPDKGKGVIIMEKSTYVTSMTSLIEGNSKYEIITAPISKFIQSIDTKINTFLENLKKRGDIAPTVYKDL